MSNLQPQNFQEYEIESRGFVKNFRDDNPLTIIQYIRLKNKSKKSDGGKGRLKRGIVVAFRGMSGEIRVGYSLYNSKKEKYGFSATVGFRKAIERSVPINEINWETIPCSARFTMRAIFDRSERYFK